jgi:F-type H+-transporting ATPase subunit b
VLLGSNFLVPGSTFIIELVAFLGVLWVLSRYVYPRLRAAMEQRQSVIRQSLEDAETARRRAEEADAEYRRTMERARQESRAMVEEANRQAQRVQEETREQAQQESRRIVAQAQTQIEAATRQATEGLRQHVSETVIAVVEKVVGEAMDARAHQELIDRTIAEVEGEATEATPASR